MVIEIKTNKGERMKRIIAIAKLTGAFVVYALGYCKAALIFACDCACIAIAFCIELTAIISFLLYSEACEGVAGALREYVAYIDRQIDAIGRVLDMVEDAADWLVGD